jgi:hypothetical protein
LFAAVESDAVGSKIAKYAGPAVFAHPLVHDQIQIDVPAAGMCDRDKPHQRLFRSITRGYAALLIFAA